MKISEKDIQYTVLISIVTYIIIMTLVIIFIGNTNNNMTNTTTTINTQQIMTPTEYTHYVENPIIHYTTCYTTPETGYCIEQ